MMNNSLVHGEEHRDFSKFMTIPNADEERNCYQSFYDATSNAALSLKVCVVCARERFANEGEQSNLLSNPSVVHVLCGVKKTVNGGEDDEVDKAVMRELLDVDEGGVFGWLCFDCERALKRETIPRLSLANNLWIGDVPQELSMLTIPEQLVIARHYPRCYIFKLFPRDVDIHLPLDQLYSGMAGNACVFELNTDEVVEMVTGQRMPSSCRVLASVIAITFVSSRRLPTDWLKKTFRVRRIVVHDALIWLKKNNPIYSDIRIDERRLAELPNDDVPDELLAIIRQEEDDDLAEREQESYLKGEVENEDLFGKHEDDGEFFKI
jgi:hypothetical protein